MKTTGLRYIKSDFGIVYCATNKVTGHKYIGSTLASLNRRKYRHEREVGCAKLHQAICKYGKDAFEWSILEDNVHKKDLIERENNWIELLDTMNPLIGYNLKTMGKGGIANDEARQKMSNSLKIALNKPEYKKTISEITRRRYLDPNASAKQSAAAGCRPFEAFKNDKSYGVFVTYKQAATALGCSISGVHRVVRGERKQCYGFTFKYVEQ